MIYSVWNWSTGQYDYFRGSGASPGTKAVGRRAQGSGVGGVQLEAALPPLPADAVLLGSGTTARGRIAVEVARAPARDALGDAFAPAPATFGQQHPWLTLGLVVGGVLLTYRLLVSTSKVLW